MMPRTKQIRKKSSVNEKHNLGGASVSKGNLLSDSHGAPPLSAQELVANEYESMQCFHEEFSIYYGLQINKHKLAYKKACEEVKNMIYDLLQQLPNVIKLSNVHGDIHKDNLEEQQEMASNFDLNISQSASSKSTETIQLKQFKTPRKVNTRSSTKKLPLATAPGPALQVEVFKTPLLSARRLPLGTTITPKIYSETPITVMRRPLHGELAISLSGSPLMVGATSCEDIPTVNVPLQDGRIFSIMPEEGAPFDIPSLDETTKKYLKTLRDHLQILAPNSP
ncbi:uncharacterized protein LOC124365150 [Homalodisca vitripennis]|uniref:uncharacterized protein LOC124365150 n=1 Tax=Homalodisca vitripennis TaxID=197043 RepID=UPI001EEB2CB1|nr:uncharacterized protein LOC124365150 [Homalodisca vitripennis]